MTGAGIGRWRSVLCAACLAHGVTASPRAMSAPRDVTALAKRLAESKDFRVRTQAALALGTSENKRARPVLCRALTDSSAAVRAAAAAALGKLKKGGRSCAKRRLQTENNEHVRRALERTLADLSQDVGSSISANTRLYVAMGKLTNQTKRDRAELERLVNKMLRKHLAALSDVAIAPDQETPKQARALMTKYKQAKGLYLMPKVKTTHSNGVLRVSVQMAMLTYPAQNYKGSIIRKAAYEGVAVADVDSENELLEAAIEAIAPQLAQTAARF